MKKLLLLGAMVLSVLLSNACQGAAPTATREATPVPTVAAPTSQVPTPSPMPTSTPIPRPTSTPSATATPAVSKPTGTLTYAIVGLGPEVWLPSKSAPVGINPMAPAWEYLALRDKNGGAIPGLATSWEMSKDGLSWTFNLRKGIQFHEGWGEFTSQDVKFSMELLTTKDSISVAKADLAAIDRYEIKDPYTITIHLKKPNWGLIYRLSNLTPAVPMLSKKQFDTMGEEKAAVRPVGTGPFKFVEHKLGEYLKFEAIEDHWRQTPAFKTLIMKAVPEEGTRVAMLRKGEADIIDVSLAFKGEVEKAGLRVNRAQGAVDYFVLLGGIYLNDRPGFDPSVPWVADPADPKGEERATKVRKALNLAVNKQEIIDYVLKGEGVASSVPTFQPGMPTYNPAWKPYPYDPQEAKRLLADAGYPQGFKLTMRIVDWPGRPDIPALSEAVAMAWEKIGLKVERRTQDWASYRPDIIARKMAGQMGTVPLPAYDEPASGLMLFAHTKSTIMYLSERPEIDAFIDKANSEVDYEKRRAIQMQLGQFYYDHYESVPIAIANLTFGTGKTIGDWPLVRGAPYAVNWEYITMAR